MSLKKEIEADIKKAMLAREKNKLKALRAIKALILLAETDGKSEGLTEGDETKILLKAVKQRKDSAQIYVEQNRPDLEEVEVFEASIIEAYLPTMLSEEEVTIEIAKIIEQVGATGPSDMGKVMGNATKALSSKAEGKIIASVTKKLLAQ